MEKLRFNWSPPPRRWLPTVEEFTAAPLATVLDYELLYVIALLIIGLGAFLLGLLLGSLLLMVR